MSCAERVAGRTLFFAAWCFAFLATAARATCFVLTTAAALNGSRTRLLVEPAGWKRPLPVLVTEIATVALVAAPALSVTVTVIV